MNTRVGIGPQSGRIMSLSHQINYLNCGANIVCTYHVFRIFSV